MKVVGFDLDDTIVAEALFLKSGACHIAKWLNERHPAIPRPRIETRMTAAITARTNHYSALEEIISEAGLAGEVDMKEVVDEFRAHLPDASIYHAAPSMTGLLDRLKHDPEIHTVLITDGRSLTQRNKIKAAGLCRYFDEDDIYISKETGHDKTDPDTFLRVMEKYAGASEFHYVGDNPGKDFLHPSRLGWITHRIHPFPLMIHQQK